MQVKLEFHLLHPNRLALRGCASSHRRMVAIGLDGVTKVFADTVTAVDDLDLEVADGEFVALLGPTGSGKTTVLRIIAGLETADRGQVRLGGRDMDGAPPRDRR